MEKEKTFKGRRVNIKLPINKSFYVSNPYVTTKEFLLIFNFHLTYMARVFNSNAVDPMKLNFNSTFLCHFPLVSFFCTLAFTNVSVHKCDNNFNMIKKSELASSNFKMIFDDNFHMTRGIRNCQKNQKIMSNMISSSSVYNDFVVCFLFLFFIISIFFVFRIMKIKKNDFKLFYKAKVILLIFLIRFAIQNDQREKVLQQIRICQNSDFFSIESIGYSNNLNFIQSQIDFRHLMLLNLKNNDCSLFAICLLLLSNDVSTNPGPVLDQNQNQLIDQIWKPFKNKGMHFLHLNINSLLPKIDEVRNFIKKANPAIIGFSESKLDNTILDSEIAIEGYVLIRLDRNRHGGGIACYIKENISFNIINGLSDRIEGIIFDILLPKTKALMVGIFYRPPDQINFLELLSQDFENLDFSNRELFFLGDFNINLYKNGKYILGKSVIAGDPNNFLVRKYNEFCSLFSLKQLIQEPTRITCNSPESLLDHILTNSTKNISQFGIVDISISDHQMIYFTRKTNFLKFHIHNEKRFRSLKKYTEKNFRELLRTVNFPDYTSFDDVNIAYGDFFMKLMNVIDEIAPFKVGRRKNNTPEWFDLEVSEKIDSRNELFKKFKKSKLKKDNELYIEARRDAKNMVISKKQIYLKEKLKENINEPKKIWKTLKSLGLNSKAKSNGKICLKEDGKVHFDSNKNAEIFKNFFSNLATDLVSKLPSAPNIYGMNSVLRYYNNLNVEPESFSLNFCNEENVRIILKDINISKASGIDNLTGRFLKDGAEILCKPISQICNLSVHLAIYPKSFKVAKLKPLFKKGSALEPQNYRPISLLPLISKVLEKIVLEQTQSFLRDNNLIYKLQSGFRSHHSTDFCLSYLCNKILTGFDSGLSTGMILIDLQKAFDTIDHEILLKKMYCIGFAENTIKWFESYLKDRTFIVSVENSISSSGSQICGVPQGSILGPLLFLLYINDIQQASDSTIILYADDSCIVFQHKTITEIEKQLNKDFKSVCSWFIDNKLSIHLGKEKTKCILFSPKNKNKKDKTLEIFHNEKKIQQYSSVTYLGCILDESMSGDEMAIKVIKKINNKLKFLYRKNQFLSKYLRRLLCNAIIQPHFDYACSTWYINLKTCLKNKLKVVQNKCIRFCLRKTFRSHIGFEDYLNINWLPVELRVNQIILCSVFKFFQKTCPNFMTEIFDPVENQNMITRTSILRLHQPKRKTKSGMNSLSYVGPSYWNKLPSNLKISENFNSFKHSLKKYFFQDLKSNRNPFFKY